MAEEIGKGYFSLLRWRSDPTRDEARNVAVILVEENGSFGGIRAAPLSRISSRLREQGLLDSILLSIEKQFAAEACPDIKELHSWHRSLQQSLYLTKPQPVSVSDPDAVLHALYKAYAAPRGGGPRLPTKGVVLDRVVDAFRRRGFDVRRGEYVKDFIFDLVVHGPVFKVVDVISFAGKARNWIPIEHQTGHFLYAIEQLSINGLVVIQPPPVVTSPPLTSVYQRVVRWLEQAEVEFVEPQELENGQLALSN